MTVLAIDPEGVSPSYRIIDGNAEGRFQIDAATGKLKAATDLLEASNNSYDLRIEATDGYKYSAITVTVTILDMVGIAGDTAAKEGGVDNILLRFVRFTADTSQDLIVYFEATELTANWDDLEDRPDRDTLLLGKITIQAGETSAMLFLEAREDGGGDAPGAAEPIQRFNVAILTTNPGPGPQPTYVTVPDYVNKDKVNAIRAYPEVLCSIVE